MKEKSEKQKELEKYFAINTAVLDYFIKHGIKIPGFDTVEYFSNLKVQVREHFDKGRLTKLKQWFRDFSEGGHDEPEFIKFIKDKTGFDLDIKDEFEKRVDKILKNGKIRNENEFRDLQIKIDSLIWESPIDEEKINRINLLLSAFDKQKKSKK